MKDLFEFAGFQLSYFPTLNGALKGATPASEQQGAVVLATPDTQCRILLYQKHGHFCPTIRDKILS